MTDDATGPGTGGVGTAATEPADPVESLTEEERRHRERTPSRAGVAAILGVVTVAVVVGFLAVTGRLGETYAAVEGGVRTARGWPGLVVIFVYSVLIAVVLPLPSEIVLAAPLELGLGTPLQLAVIVLVSSAGKALGSLAAFHAGQEAKRSGPVVRRLRRSRVDVVEWSESTAANLVQRYGYVGLALALCVPGFPDTISIYAFSMLDGNYSRFAAATFVGSAGRLVVTLGVVGAVVGVA